MAASTVMELAATALGSRYAVADITALNSNAINVTAGLLIPASITGLGPRTGQGILVAAWYAGLTVLALAFAYRNGGLGRLHGSVIIGGYLAFVTALAISVAQYGTGPGVAVIPAAAVTTAGAALLTWPSRQGQRSRTELRGRRGWWWRDSLLPGWSTGRMWLASLGLCLLIAACDAVSGPHLILIGLLICGPCCALFTARWQPTAATGLLAVALGVVLGIPDQIWATFVQYAFLAAVAVVAVTATAGAAVPQHRHA